MSLIFAWLDAEGTNADRVVHEESIVLDPDMARRLIRLTLAAIDNGTPQHHDAGGSGQLEVQAWPPDAYHKRAYLVCASMRMPYTSEPISNSDMLSMLDVALA